MSHIPENPKLPGPRPRRKPSRHPAKLKDKEEKLLAGRVAADRVLQNHSITALADKYHIGPGRVKRLLDLAEKNGLIEHYRAGIFDDLLPKAIAVYEAHLEAGNLEAARDIVQGLGVLNPKNTPLAPGESEETLEVYRLRRRLAQQTELSLDGQAGNLPVVDGELSNGTGGTSEAVAGPGQSALSESRGVEGPSDPPISGSRGDY